MGALTPFLDDIVLGAGLVVATLLLAPGWAPWVLLGFLLWLGIKLFVLRAHFRRPAIGVEAMEGRVATVLRDLDPRGHVDLDGEIWEAEAPGLARRGEQVRVERVEGLLLKVAPMGVVGPVWSPRRDSVLLTLARRLRRG